MYVVWEPVLATDVGAPSTTTLARVPDLRTSQYWDKSRLLSHVLGEQSRASIVWDYVAVYPRGTTWDTSFPQAVSSGHPVVKVIDRTQEAILHLLSQSGPSKAQASGNN